MFQVPEAPTRNAERARSSAAVFPHAFGDVLQIHCRPVSVLGALPRAAFSQASRCCRRTRVVLVSPAWLLHRHAREAPANRTAHHRKSRLVATVLRPGKSFSRSPVWQPCTNNSSWLVTVRWNAFGCACVCQAAGEEKPTEGKRRERRISEPNHNLCFKFVSI